MERSFLVLLIGSSIMSLRAYSVPSMVVICGLLYVGLARFQAGELRRVVPYFLGERLFLDSEKVDLGLVMPGEEIVVQFGVRNASLIDVVVVGVESTCSCLVSTDEFPVTLGANESYVQHISIAPPTESGKKFLIKVMPVLSSSVGFRPSVLISGETKMDG